MHTDTYEFSVDGGDHEFTVSVSGKAVANVWHSDRGEWTVEFVSGPVARRGSRDDAIEFIAAQVAANAV